MTLGEFFSEALQYLYGYWPFRIVSDWEQGIRLRFGRITSLLRPGLHAFWPIIGEIHVEETAIDVNTTPNQTVADAAGEPVTFSLALKFRIVDLSKMWRSIQDHESTVINEITASAASLVPLQEPSELFYDLADAVYQDTAERLEEWGVELLGVTLHDFCRPQTLRLLGD